MSVRTHNSRERGNSAPPSLSDHSESISPISPVSPMGTFNQFGTLQHTSSMPIGGLQDRLERPLPPLPSQFRLGEDGLPWTTEPWYIEPEPESEYGNRTIAGIELENRRQEDPQRVRDLGALHQAMMMGIEHGNRERENRRQEDPQRVRDLGALHQAMMTVDSLPHEDAWDSVAEMPRGPSSLGWAVRSEDSRHGLSPGGPPPHVVSQFEQALARGVGMRPRSSG